MSVAWVKPGVLDAGHLPAGKGVAQQARLAMEAHAAEGVRVRAILFPQHPCASAWLGAVDRAGIGRQAGGAALDCPVQCLPQAHSGTKAWWDRQLIQQQGGFL